MEPPPPSRLYAQQSALGVEIPEGGLCKTELARAWQRHLQTLLRRACVFRPTPSDIQVMAAGPQFSRFASSPLHSWRSILLAFCGVPAESSLDVQLSQIYNVLRPSIVFVTVCDLP